MSARITLKSKPDPNAPSPRKPTPVIDYDPNTREMWKNGFRVGFLSPQSASFLNLLLAKNGQVATHDELTSTIWPNDSERPLTTGERIRELVGDLRQTLGDTRKERIFIENIPRIGYRFIGQIESSVPQQPVPSPVTEVPENPPPSIPPETNTSTRNRSRRWAIAAAIAALGLLTTAAVLSRKFTVFDTGQPKSELLWHGPAAFRFGEVSRDGRFLCYTDPKTTDLQVRDLTNGSTISLTSTSPKSQRGAVRACLFSDDGKRIAFRRDMGESQDVYVVAVDDSSHGLLYSHRNQNFRITDWSPDGGHIAAITCPSYTDGEIWELDTHTGSISNKYPVPHCPFTAKYSPDGRSIAFDSGFEDRDRHIFVTTDSGPAREVASEPGIGRLIDWTNDGTGLLYTGSEGSHFETQFRYVSLRANHPSSTPTVLVSNSPFSRVLGIAGDSGLYYIHGSSAREIHTADVDVQTARLIHPPSAFRENPQNSEILFDWSPNGSRICSVIQYGQSGRPEISLVKIREGSTSRRLFGTQSLGDVTAISWMPDGHSLLVSSRKETSSSISKIDSSTGEITRLRWSSDPKATLHMPAQSAFNGVIYYKQRVVEREPSPLFRMTTENPAEDREFLPSVYSYKLSVDGRQLVYSTFDQDFEYVRLVDLASSKATQLHREPREGRIVSVALTPDSKHVLYSKRGQLWKISTSGGKPQMLPLNMPAMRDLNVHPNGRTLAFLAGDPEAGDLWVMRNIITQQQRASVGNSVF